MKRQIPRYWTEKETKKLRRGIKKYGNNWTKIHKKYRFSRSKESLIRKASRLGLIGDRGREVKPKPRKRSKKDKLEEKSIANNTGRTRKNKSKQSQKMSLEVKIMMEKEVLDPFRSSIPLDSDSGRFPSLSPRILPKYDSNGMENCDVWSLSKNVIYCEKGISMDRMMRSCHYYQRNENEVTPEIQICFTFSSFIADQFSKIIIRLLNDLLEINAEIAIICHSPYECSLLADQFLVKKMDFCSSGQNVKEFLSDIPKNPICQSELKYSTYDLAFLEANSLNWRRNVRHKLLFAILDNREITAPGTYFNINVKESLLEVHERQGVKINFCTPHQHRFLEEYSLPSSGISYYSSMEQVSNFVRGAVRDTEMDIGLEKIQAQFGKGLDGDDDEEEEREMDDKFMEGDFAFNLFGVDEGEVNLLTKGKFELTALDLERMDTESTDPTQPQPPGPPGGITVTGVGVWSPMKKPDVHVYDIMSKFNNEEKLENKYGIPVIQHPGTSSSEEEEEEVILQVVPEPVTVPVPEEPDPLPVPVSAPDPDEGIEGAANSDVIVAQVNPKEHPRVIAMEEEVKDEENMNGSRKKKRKRRKSKRKKPEIPLKRRRTRRNCDGNFYCLFG